MPGFDGTGPRGLGPMTGRGEGYCAIALPSPGTARAPYGYAGLAGVPVGLALSPAEGMGYPYGRSPAFGSAPSVATAPYAPAPYSVGRPRRGMRFLRGRGRGRGAGPRSGRGRRRW
jgi:hypothetical protein